MATTVKYRRIDEPTFRRQHDEACDALEDSDVPQTLPRTYGEIKIPGHGWYPCVLNDKGQPSWFYDEDDGWNLVPQNQKFEAVK